jgi:threonyl-tRNA synthetase
MRILQLHCDSIEYTPTKKEIKMAEDIENPELQRLDEVVVAFVAIEDGDDSSVAQDAISQIKDSMKTIGCKKLLLYPYAHLSSNLAKPSVAMTLLSEMEDNASDLDVSHSPFGWTKSYKIQVKGHPLAESSKVVTKDSADSKDEKEITSEALKGESKIRSYWKIMSPDGAMTNLGDFDFSNHKKLEILSKYESNKQRNVDEPPPHVALMKKMGIADYESASDSGNMKFFPNGRLIKSLIESYVTDRVKDYGGQYNIDSEGKKLFLRFAACFGQFLMANQYQMSYKNLPYRLYELTRYSFRREQSGELVGLRRLRAFTMPDCHAFCSDLEQAVDEIKVRFDLSQSVIHELGIDESDYEMAIRFTEDFYNENKSAIEERKGISSLYRPN